MQLNPFEIKAEISHIYDELKGIKDVQNYDVHYRILDIQEDKNIVVKLLFKEISNENQILTKFLLRRYCPEDELIEKLWNIIKNNLSSNQAKIFALDLLRDIDTNWTYDECNKYLDNPDEFVESDTKRILDNAIVNPEVQIDFLDFLNSLAENDQVILLNSFAKDYSKDELANMLIPVFLSMPDTEAGKTALELLGDTKSQLAYHALNDSLQTADDSLKSSINRNLSKLKLAGIREDNTYNFYRELLKNSKPYKFCITYPDGHGNQAIIVSRITDYGKIQFIAIVIDDYTGIKDCFGFNDISQFECNAIIERFYRGQRAIELEPQVMRWILLNAEKMSKKLPYEYVCWKNLLMDIEPKEISLDYKAKQLNENEFENILKYDFTDFWFLDSEYSDEFEDFLELTKQTPSEEFDKKIDENIDKIFFQSEEEVWTERILNCAILKHLSGDEESAQNLYSLYNDKKLIKEFFKNIVRKSIYEYYFSIKDEKRVKSIEDMWVNA